MHSISKTYNVRHRVIAVPVCFCEEKKIWISLALTHSVCVCHIYEMRFVCCIYFICSLLHTFEVFYGWTAHNSSNDSNNSRPQVFLFNEQPVCVCVRLCLCMSYLFRLSIGIFNAFSSSHFFRSCSYNSLKISNDKRGQLQQESEHTRKTRMHHSICSLSSCYFF